MEVKENKSLLIRIFAVVLILGVIAGSYIIGRNDGTPGELAEINRKIDNLGTAVTEQQRNFEGFVSSVAKQLGQFADELENLGVGQGKIVSGFGQMASRLSKINSDILGAIDRLDESKGIVGANDEPLRELLSNLQRLQAIVGPENTRPTK